MTTPALRLHLAVPVVGGASPLAQPFRGCPSNTASLTPEGNAVIPYHCGVHGTLGNNPPPVEVSVKLDSQTGMARVFAEKQVVDEVFDERFEIDYVDA